MIEYRSENHPGMTETESHMKQDFWKDLDLDQFLERIDLNGLVRRMYDKSAFAIVQDRQGFSVRSIGDLSGGHTDPETQKASAKEQFKYMFEHFYDTGDPDHFSGYELFYIFVFGSVFGSWVEELWCRVSNGYWENRTSVVYGHLSFAEAIGSVFLTALLYKDMDEPVEQIFAKSFVWGSVLEYIMSWGEETFTGYRSWDYSHRLFNINGRICLMYSMFWGILGVVWCKLIYPVLKVLIEKLPKDIGIPLFWGLTVFLLYDMIVSGMAKTRFTARQDGEEARNRLERWLDKKFDDERIIKTYPNSIRSKDGEIENDTLNNTTAKAMENSPIKAALKQLDIAREEGNFAETATSLAMDMLDKIAPNLDTESVRAAMEEFLKGITDRDPSFDAESFRKSMEDYLQNLRERMEPTVTPETIRSNMEERTGEVRANMEERVEEVRDQIAPVLEDGKTAFDPKATKQERKSARRRAARTLFSMILPQFDRH